MKKLIYLLFFLNPLVVLAQLDGYKSSPFDYMWMNVGNAGFSAGQVADLCLALNSSGQPYVAYRDAASGKATVMKFDGTNWVNVGTAGFSAGRVWSESLAFSPIGQPYVAYNDGVNSYKATVMKYDFPNGNIEPRQSLPSLYPNPASNELTIESLPIPALSQLTISNIDGQQLITRQITQPKIQLDISSLPSGMYIVRLTGDKTVSTSKFIKQ